MIDRSLQSQVPLLRIAIGLDRDAPANALSERNIKTCLRAARRKIDPVRQWICHRRQKRLSNRVADAGVGRVDGTSCRRVRSDVRREEGNPVTRAKNSSIINAIRKAQSRRKQLPVQRLLSPGSILGTVYKSE